MTGRARDAAVARYRPTVKLSKTQSGGASADVQAEWMLRHARAQSERLTYTVLDWRAGEDRKLWRPNELAAVTDPYGGIEGDMIIGGVTYSYDEAGARTVLDLAGPEAFDLEPAEPRQRERQRPRQPATDRTARPLTAEPAAPPARPPARGR
jgi:prophage tail gpP-like protein